jgi:spore maturation protein CgeB
MRVLWVAMAHEYGVESRGPSFEEVNFRSALDGMGHEVAAFDFMARKRRDGLKKMRRDLVATAAEARPDVAFFFLFQDELDATTIEAVGREGRCPTINWFADDHWRFEDFSRHIAPAFDVPVTTDPDAVEKYHAAGIDRVHLSQWACNRHAYHRVPGGLEHDVTFVGMPHGDRRAIVDRLRQAGHPVEAWGLGWPQGRLDHDGMVRVFSTSAINLNLSNSSQPPSGLRALLTRARGRMPSGPRPPQIKGRNFEVPGCGGFLLTERVPHLERYFAYDREIGVYDDADDLVEKVGHWLAHPEERAAVAEAGYRRVLAEHTYDHRFAEIFRVASVG